MDNFSKQSFLWFLITLPFTLDCVTQYFTPIWDLGSLLFSSLSDSSYLSTLWNRQCGEAGCRQTMRGCCCDNWWCSALSLPLPVTYGWHPARDPSWAGDTAAGAWLLASCKRGLWECRLGEEGGVCRERESEGYCRCRAHDPPRWALHGAEEVRQAGRHAALMGLPWGSTDG